MESATMRGMTDEQINLLWEHTNTSIWLLGKWLNSAALWELVGLFLGALIVASLIAMALSRIYSLMGFRTRE